MEITSSTASIEEILINGAGSFIQANSDIHTFSKKYEMSDLEGPDFNGMYNDANDAISNLEMTAYYYSQLVSKANNTPYNETVINTLQAFDYDGFRQENGLIKPIFDDVAGYLSTGDVRGVYSRILNDINGLLNRLYTVRWLLYWGYLPDNKTMWDLNQDTGKIYLFGQYASRVFYEIK